jgi:Tfp pilus assembly protein PilO
MSLETKDIIAAAKRRPLLFVCGAIVLAAGVLSYFRMDVRGQVEDALAEREKELKRLSNNVRFAVQLDNHLQSLREANEKIAAGALRVGELARNQQVFYRIEADSGVKLLDLRQAPLPAPARGAAATTTYVSIPFTLTVRGEYPQLIDFLNRLDRVATLSRVTSANTSFNPATKDEGQALSLTVELLGFRS